MKDLKFPLGAINRNSLDGSAHAFNIRLKDGALRPVDAPTETIVPFGVEYIHSAQDYKNLIGYETDHRGNTIVSFLGTLPASDIKPTRIGSFLGDVLEVKHIGNTLIFLTSAGTQYFLFKDGTYRRLGNKIPMPRIQFGCTDFDGTTADEGLSEFKDRIYNSVYFANSEDSAIKYNYFRGAWAGKAEDISEVKNDITNDFSANFNKSINSIFDAGAIPEFPIQLRYAIKLYDGSYIYHSAPILVSQNAGLDSIVYCPTEFNDALKRAWLAPNKVTDDSLLENDWTTYPPEPTPGIDYIKPGITEAPKELLFPLQESLAKLLSDDLASTLEIPESKINTSRLAIKVKSLMFKLTTENHEELDLWSDIIDSIDIFISKQVTPFKIGELADFPNDDNLQVWYGYDEYVDHLSRDVWANFAADYLRYAPYSNLPKQSIREIHDAVAGNGNFFLLKSIGIYDGEYKKEEYQNRWVNLANEIHDHYAIIETQKQLHSDFTSHHVISGRTAYIYNQSLHLGNISTKMFQGFSPADLCVYCGDKGKYSNRGYITTTIEGAETKQAVSVNSSSSEGTYFISPLIFYPDTKAIKFDLAIADIVSETIMHDSFTAKPHEMLTGAYFLTEDLTPIVLNRAWQEPIPPQSISPIIIEPNKVIASAISNPFVFNADQTNYVGNGEVIALCAASTALSQGQFGQYPLYVFCSDGIYAMSMSNQGVYANVSPISFDVILRKNALAPTENAIIFASEQGVKLLKGSSTTSLSDPLNGPTHDYTNGKPYDNPQLREFLNSICNGGVYADFKDFILDNAVEIHFDYPNNEAWVARPGDKFAYIFNLDSKSWSYRTFSAEKFLPQYPHLYLRNKNKLLDVTATNKNKLPMALVTNPIPTQVFAQYSDLRIDCNLFANQFKCLMFAGNNNYRLPYAKSKGFTSQSPKPVSGVHLSRIPLSARFLQLAIRIDADDAALYSVSANVNPQPYNDKK